MTFNRRQMLVKAAAAFGASLAAPIAFAVRAGAEPGAGIANPFMTDDQRRMVEIIAEMIIPRTNTAGAIDAEVPEFIEMMVSDYYGDAARKFFIYGLRDLDHHCLSSFGKRFLDCTDEQRIVALEDAEANAVGAISDGVIGPGGNDGAIQVGDPAMWGDSRQDAGNRFFNEIKSLTVLGYYTSEIGAKAELLYDPVPGGFEDIDFATVGKHQIS